MIPFMPDIETPDEGEHEGIEYLLFFMASLSQIDPFQCWFEAPVHGICAVRADPEGVSLGGWFPANRQLLLFWDRQSIDKPDDLVLWPTSAEVALYNRLGISRGHALYLNNGVINVGQIGERGDS